MGKRRKSRVFALQVMYQLDAGAPSLEEAFRTLWETQQATAEVRRFAEDLVFGFHDNRKRIDLLVGEHARHWKPERMAVVDRNILRLGIYELLYRPDIPPKVTMNEFVEIAKKFSTEDSGAFVNGILDRIYQDHRMDSAEALREE